MSQENVEVVRSFYECWTNQDLDGVLDCAHADFEFDWSASQAPFGGIYTGHEGFRRFWTEHNDAWEEFRLEIVEAVECANERVITVTVVRGRGQGSGISIEGTGAVLWKLRERRVLSVRLFQRREKALKAVRLSEQDISS
jgi:ketosteroid isomerase-like protein